ncbi:iporin [Nephila pilipes]|uniref:Iporin n=1 Tax=Nephila pilipes TaxID=299642 RepID=A0A8X6TIM5_NEPPI|nr:iporin [Nephila pilipes]
MMDTLVQGHRVWETNGNIMVVRKTDPSTPRITTTEQGCAVQGMIDSDQSSQNISCYDSDWNSNQFLAPSVKTTDQKSLDDSFFEQYSNVKDNVNKDLYRKCPSSPAGSPTTAAYGASLHQKDLSYDDLSKNIDANLAEIDMETFRSEDINSILALPAIYSGDFQSESRGEQCASVSGSLLNGLELDTSARSNRHSEDEISICKDEPLFSPLREPPAQATISVDSLDNSSSYEQDLVLTCKANKNNYTIVFEGSSTQFSDDSDYQDVCRSSEGESSLSGAVQINYSSSFKKQSSMVQSDVAFTTWSKLWKSHKVTRRRSCDSSTKISNKSQSLPNLNNNSVLITDKQLNQWAKWCGNHRFPLYEIVQNYQATGMHVAGSKECLHSISLLKLFMKHKVASNSSIGSSGQSDSSTSLILQPLNFRNASLQNSLNISDKIKPLQRHTDDTVEPNQKDKNRAVGQNDNDTRMFVDNIQLLDWNSVQNLTETNNNNINSLYNTTENNVPNNNNIEEIRATAGNEDCDNSQYFEDSLMDNPSPPLKHFHATPIKEEEETDISSGDEVMRDSKNPFGSDDSSGEITVIQNNTLAHANRQETGLNLERINNVFPSSKSNAGYTLPVDDALLTKKSGSSAENHSQSTQTKQFNINECCGPEAFKPLHTFSCKTSSNQTDCDTVNTVQYTASRDSSPASSGYVSSRHSSVERLRHSSQGNIPIHSSPATVNVPVQKSNVVLTTTCTCGTQIPVHVKDSSVQTSTLYNSNSSSGFTLKESTSALPEPNKFPSSQTSVKSPLQNMGSQTKSRQKDNKKSIYVCYPNYSLPDLSFLKSVIEENSESVFLTPTEYKLPQDIINQKRPSRPKSYGAYESILQKHLTKIKDWESLNVLLPDDLKILISKTHGKGVKMDGSASKDPLHSRNQHQNLSSSYCNVDDATKLKANFIDPSYKRHMPRSILRKSSSVEQCEDRQCRVHLPIRCTSASSVICSNDGGKSPDRETLQYKQVFCDGFRQNVHCIDSKCPSLQKADASLKKYHPTHDLHSSPGSKQCSPCSSCKSSSPPLSVHDVTIHDKKPTYSFENFKDENLLQDFTGKNIPYPFNNENLLPSFDQKNETQTVESHINCLHGKKAVKFCERSPTKSSKQLDACKPGRCCSCDTQNRSSDEFHGSQCSCDICTLESERPPQEFLVSPTQNTLMYPEISDSYTLQNFSGGGKFFQEALRRKTGLVENLRKATQIIFEHHKNSNKKGVDLSYSMGQKILTWLCPAVHTILSDGLLPSVQGFFGPLPNSPWKVAGASIKQGETRKDVEELLNHVTSEKLLTDSTYRFNAFILGLLNLGCFEWWLGHLCACQSLICHHYHPTALLSLLALPAAVHLRHELKELVSPLSNLPFNLDIIFETKVTNGENWKKYDVGNFRPSGLDYQPETKHPKDHDDLNLQFSPCKQTMGNKINDFSLKTKHSQVLSPCSNLMNIRSDAEECHENQVWPGITINPFPNAKFAEEFNITSHTKKEKNQSGRGGVNFLRDTLLPREVDQNQRRGDMPHFSLCSSTDSGCSSQIEHMNHTMSPAAAANDESPNVDVKEGQQFKMLRQKWEKISHGMNKQAVAKAPSPKATATKPTISSSSKSKKKAEVSPPRLSHGPKDIAVPKTPTKTPPTRRAQGKINLHAGVSNEVKLAPPDILPSEVNEKRKSQIPMLKFTKGPQPKLRINRGKHFMYAW